MVDLLAVLAEPSRRRLLQLLSVGEQSVTALATHFDTTRAAVSQHLAALADAGLVASRQEGRFRYYRLDPEGMAALRKELDAFWTREIDDLASGRPTTKGVPDAD